MSDDAQPLNIGDRRFELLVRAITDYAIYMLDPDGLRVEVVSNR